MGGHREGADGHSSQEGSEGGILHSSIPPAARKWLFKDKHLRPGRVCRNLSLGTGLVQRAQTPEQELS